jgi:hypothetical protein
LDFNKNVIFASCWSYLFFSRLLDLVLSYSVPQWLQGSKLFISQLRQVKTREHRVRLVQVWILLQGFSLLLILSPAQLLLEIFLLRAGDRALFHFSCCLNFSPAKRSVTRWLRTQVTAPDVLAPLPFFPLSAGDLTHATFFLRSGLSAVGLILI